MPFESVDDELRKLFAPYNQKKESSGSTTIIRPFLCLGGPFDIAVPNRNYSNVLTEAGLGYRLVQMETAATITQLRLILPTHYPSLYGIGFEFMKSCSGAPGDYLLPIAAQGDSNAVLLFSARNNIVYIRPSIQLL